MSNHTPQSEKRNAPLLGRLLERGDVAARRKEGDQNQIRTPPMIVFICVVSMSRYSYPVYTSTP